MNSERLLKIASSTARASDAGGGIQHGRLVDEIAALRTVGLSGARALAAASWAARDWLGVPGLVPGASADLLVTRSDPRLDPDTLRHPALLLLRGRALSGRALSGRAQRGWTL